MTHNLKLFTAALLASSILATPGAVWAAAATAAPPTAQAAATAAPVEEVIVRGQFIPDEKRETSEIANVLTPEDIQRIGDSDIAGALSRVTGLTLVGDGYVYVRGLGERYSSALLDGSTLPSPEPLRRVVSLDLFPTSMLASTLVQKTYSVEYPAEFGGGLIAMRTRAIPELQFLELSVSGGYNTQGTFKRGNFFDYGNLAWLGFRDDAMKFPDLLKQNPRLEGVTGDERQAASRSLRNVWSFDRETIAPDSGVRVSGGTSFDVDGMRLGVLGVVDYSNKFRLRDGPRRSFAISNSGLEINEDLSPTACSQINSNVSASTCGVFRTNWDVRLDMLGAVGLQIDDNNQVKLTSMLLRKTNNEARVERGSFRESPGTVISKQRANFVEQQVWTNQLTGEHHIGLDGMFEELEIDWRAAYAKANRDTPYRREYTYSADSQGTFRWDLASGRNSTIFSALEDENKEFGGDGILTGRLGGRDTIVKFGGVTIDKKRDFLQRRYQFNLYQNISCGVIPQETLEMVPEIILSPDNIGASCGFAAFDSSDNSDQFNADMNLDAVYGSVEYQLIPDLRATLGARFEHSGQSIATFEQGPVGSPLVPVNVDLKADYLLPATTVTWEFADGFQARIGYSQTLARPDLRELAPSEFFDIDTGFVESGNPNLRITKIHNYDARVEWYFGERRSATIGAFYKELQDPIERTFFFAGDTPQRSLANADTAKLLGAEVEFDVALPLEDWLQYPWVMQRGWFLLGNFTYIDSKVERTLADFPNVTQREGALQGQSRYIANLQFGYDSPELLEKAALSLGYQSKRIFGVGILGIPDTIETPPLSLDFNASKGFEVYGKALELGVKVENILGGKYKTTQGGLTSESYKLGTIFSLSATATF